MMQQAILGGGCFWCVEAVMQRLKGVDSVVSGYAGGDTANPTYREVCSGNSGHVEVVKVIFDEKVVTYKDLLEVFFTTHDPTQVNGQGADIGTQYRSIIMYLDEQQKKLAKEVIKEVSKLYQKPLATELVPEKPFYSAEDYHQDYYEHNSKQPYCMAVIDPKLHKLRQKHADKLK